MVSRRRFYAIAIGFGAAVSAFAISMRAGLLPASAAPIVPTTIDIEPFMREIDAYLVRIGYIHGISPETTKVISALNRRFITRHPELFTFNRYVTEEEAPAAGVQPRELQTRWTIEVEGDILITPPHKSAEEQEEEIKDALVDEIASEFHGEQRRLGVAGGQIVWFIPIASTGAQIDPITRETRMHFTSLFADPHDTRSLDT